QADVVLFVLDCRNPLLFRSESLEARIVAKGKRFLYVLNKIDTGLTQHVAKIKVTNHISVLDTPGVLLCAPERLDELERAIRAVQI
uniref:Guanine nucleotide-binding protein-like 3 homolog n=1 Tax=Dermatophagoides pteronyssinus TaxID=6956 RepID=A0A6P6Y7R8_DERPT